MFVRYVQKYHDIDKIVGMVTNNHCQSWLIMVFCFFLAWMYIGMAGGSIFIILQLILLVDFAHSWHSKWLVIKIS